MSEYKNFGQVGAMGENARSDNNQFAQVGSKESIDLPELATQIARVRTEMKKLAKPDDPEQDAEIGILAQAEKAAKDGNSATALGFLKTTGKWTADIVKAVSASLLKDIIEGKF